MIDLKLIREETERVREAVQTLQAEAPIDEILALDEERRSILVELEDLRHERNVKSKAIGKMKDAEERQQKIDEMSAVNARIKELEEMLRATEDQLDQHMYLVPNLPHESVPVGIDESENKIIRQEGEPKGEKEFGFSPQPHWDLGPALGVLDFERGVKLSGSRFYLLLGMGARLQRALIQWMLEVHVREHGYTEIYPPALVREECMWGAGQLPKFRDNIYHDAEEDLWMVGTAEIPLTNIHRDEILEIEELPKKYVAYSPCFRREKFSAGRDVRGIKRGHQFDKVEMYHFTTPERSYMVTGDLGFTASKKYDLELWAPGCGEWLEVSSCSNCESFQARRANIRYRPDADARPVHVHTLNGSGLALPRVLIAILENYQQADGSVVIPEVLRPWMGGVEKIKSRESV
jgi:seryl-tRNA synthetase